MNLLCTLDRETLIEVFNLEGSMTKIIDQEKMDENFKTQKCFFTTRVMQRHIPKSKKEKCELLKKVGDFMPLEFFSKYFSYIVFGIDKVMRLDSTMNTLGYVYIMALDTHDLHHNVGYDFLIRIIIVIRNDIIAT